MTDVRKPFQHRPSGTAAPGITASPHPISDLDLQMRTVGGIFRMRASLARELSAATSDDDLKKLYAKEAETWDNAANLLVARLEKREGRTP